MTKRELVADVAERTGYSKSHCNDMVDAVLDSMGDALVNDSEVILRGFGSFRQKLRSARTGRHPKTGEVLEIPEKLKIEFNPAKAILDDLNA